MGVVRCGPAEGEGVNDGKACPCLTNTQTSACESEWRRGGGRFGRGQSGRKRAVPNIVVSRRYLTSLTSTYRKDRKMVGLPSCCWVVASRWGLAWGEDQDAAAARSMFPVPRVHWSQGSYVASLLLLQGLSGTLTSSHPQCRGRQATDVCTSSARA
ncbi:hypothetical protein VFPBJ_05779 [Purpureocillium lilacinum]|uniref:Uncharacterized protein n=1 Tax=Purpureocillium lilacinum TaxID=33203 RepID=A0A179GQN6_PURLI|nr:hypothetical protein VFPBJ_05779 [Purpureocillium lilacinum]